MQLTYLDGEAHCMSEILAFVPGNYYCFEDNFLFSVRYEFMEGLAKEMGKNGLDAVFSN